MTYADAWDAYDAAFVRARLRPDDTALAAKAEEAWGVVQAEHRKGLGLLPPCEPSRFICRACGQTVKPTQEGRSPCCDGPALAPGSMAWMGAVCS